MLKTKQKKSRQIKTNRRYQNKPKRMKHQIEQNKASWITWHANKSEQTLISQQKVYTFEREKTNNKRQNTLRQTKPERMEQI